MRRWLFIAVLLLAGACSDRRDFDERYQDTASELEERANAIDRNLAAENSSNMEVSANR